jgi:rSAM/selenodomain-associated transferase 1
MCAFPGVSSDAKSHVLIFSKSAEIGKVKTRLLPTLTEKQALSLHVALLQDTIEKIKTTGLETSLYMAGSGECGFEHGLHVKPQIGAHLGERMGNAFQESLQGHDRVVIVGTDSPTFPPEQIQKAIAALSTHDIVLGPCDDGGYYLIALKKFIPEAFLDIPWGTSKVLQITLQAVQNHRIFQLETYFDIDQPADLDRLRADLRTSQAPYLAHTRAWIAANHWTR